MPPGLDALYTLFGWPGRTGGGGSSRHRVLLVGIANAVDMMDKFLPELPARRTMPAQLLFTPYSPAAVEAICTARLGSLAAGGVAPPIIAPVALTLLSRKVGGASGDVRRALELACTAVVGAAARWCSRPPPVSALPPAVATTAAAAAAGTDSTANDDFDAEVAAAAGAPSRAGSPTGAGADKDDDDDATVIDEDALPAHRAPCTCTRLPWATPPDALAAAPTPTSTPARYAVEVADMAGVLAAALGSRHGRVLAALPRQAQVVVCAARALCQREARLAAAKAACSDAKKPAPATSANAVAVPLLAAAYTALCRRLGVTPLPRMEMQDLVDRIIADGVFGRQATVGAGGSGGGKAGRGPVSGGGSGWQAASVYVNVCDADLDAAFAAAPFYAQIAHDIRTGTVNVTG